MRKQRKEGKGRWGPGNDIKNLSEMNRIRSLLKEKSAERRAGGQSDQTTDDSYGGDSERSSCTCPSFSFDMDASFFFFFF